MVRQAHHDRVFPTFLSEVEGQAQGDRFLACRRMESTLQCLYNHGPINNNEGRHFRPVSSTGQTPPGIQVFLKDWMCSLASLTPPPFGRPDQVWNDGLGEVSLLGTTEGSLTFPQFF